MFLRKNRFLSKVLIFNILPFLVLFSLSACLKMRMSQKAIFKEFKDTGYEPKISTYQIDQREIYYVEIGNDTLPTVIFVHGAPGSWTAFKNFMIDSALLSQVRMIAVDRPGYGFSGLGKEETSIEKQAAMLKPLLEKNTHAKLPILVGHSYGGPIVARMAMDFPNQVGALIMAAPAIDPAHEKFFLVNRPANWFIFRWMIPRSLRVSNDEKLSHVKELEKMLPFWEKIQNPTTLIHGEKDKIVPIENSYFGEKMIPKSSLKAIYEPKLNHLIPWKRPDLIKNNILKYLE